MTYTEGSVFGDALASFQRAARSTSDAKATLASMREVAANARTAQASAQSRADELIAMADEGVTSADSEIADAETSIQTALGEELVAVQNLQRTAQARREEIEGMIVPAAQEAPGPSPGPSLPE